MKKIRKQFYAQIEGLAPGLTQITTGPADETAGLKVVAPHWQQRVWEQQLLNDEAVLEFLKKQDVVFTNWREIMARFENAGATAPRKRANLRRIGDLGQHFDDAAGNIVQIPTFDETAPLRQIRIDGARILR